MIIETIAALGPWVWIILGALLLTAEVMLPGVFLMWFGAAALVIGGLSLLPFAEVSWWPWQVQMLAFGVLAFVLAFVGRYFFPTDDGQDEASALNRPLERFVGREAVLSEALENGYGRVKLGDTLWRVQGPALAAGARVKVIAVQGETLIVEAL